MKHNVTAAAIRRFLSALLSAALLLPVCAVFSGCSGGGVSETESTDPYGGTPVSGTFSGSDSLRACPDLPEALKNVSILPEGANGAVIPTSGVFTVKTGGATDAQTVAANLSLTPAVPFEVTAVSDTEFTLRTVSPLSSGTLCRLTVGSGGQTQSSFAFQTESEFLLTAALPANGSDGVPTNTGIELTFSEKTAGASDFGKYFSISPEVRGRFETYPDGKTVVFVPEKTLAENTVYTVTVSGSLSGISGKTLGEDAKISFRTSDGKAGTDEDSAEIYLSIVSDPVFKPGAEIVIPYDVWFNRKNNLSEGKITAKLYRYPSADAAAAAMKGFLEYQAENTFTFDPYLYPTDGLPLAAEHSFAYPPADDYGQKYVSIPSPDAGIYLCCLDFGYSVGGNDRSAAFQLIVSVSGIDAYAEGNSDSLLVWTPELSGNTVRCETALREDGGIGYSSSEKTAAKDGTSVFETGGAGVAFITIRNGNDELLLCRDLSGVSPYYGGMMLAVADGVYSGGFYRGGESASSDYFSEIFTDREVYFSSDTVRFSGVIRPSVGEIEIPSCLWMTTGASSEKKYVSVDGAGRFSGSFEIDSWNDWGVPVSFSDGDGKVLIYRYVTVTEQEKPVYRASLALDKLFYLRGDQMTATVSASFFDGTPAGGLDFSLSCGGSSKTGTSGADGSASLTFTAGSDGAHYSTSPDSTYVWGNLIGFETENTYLDASAPYFPSNYLFDAENDGKTVTAQLHHLDVSRLLTEKDIYGENWPEIYYGGAAEGSISVSLIKHKQTATLIGTRYDPITKTTAEMYDYNWSESVERTAQRSFEDGKIVLETVEPDGFEGYYDYKLTFTDPESGASYTHEIYAGKHGWYRGSYGNGDSFELTLDGNGQGEYELGEHLTVSPLRGGVSYSGLPTLVSLYGNDGIADHTVTDGASVPFEFTESLVHGAEICGTVFADGRFFNAGSLTPSFACSAREMEVSVSADGDSFRPGDKVNVTVSADPGAVMTVAVVDEACFALGEQTLNPEYSFYRSAYSYPRVSSSPYLPFYSAASVRGAAKGMSYAAPTAMNYAEAEEAAADRAYGSDNGSEQPRLREDFRDCAVFENIVCGSDGKAVLSFTAPDNITSWRVTAVGSAESGREDITSLRLGSAVSGVICTLPFFVSVSNSTEFITGDEAVVFGRVYGSAPELGENAEVRYTFALEGGRRNSETNLTAPAGERAFCSFGMLEEGSYSVTVTAFCGEYSDAVKTSFDVVNDAIRADIFRDGLRPEEIEELAPKAYPVDLVFYDSSYDGYFRVLPAVTGGKGDRLDSKAGRYAGLISTETLFGAGTYAAAEAEAIKKEFNEDGKDYCSLLPYSEDDVFLTAKIALAVPGLFGDGRRARVINRAEAYISQKEYASSEELAAAYAILAAFSRPVLSDLRYLTANDGDFSDEAKLWIAAALTACGDWGGADEYLMRLDESGKFVSEENERRYAGENGEESIRLTALRLFSEAVLHPESASELVSYLLSHTARTEQYPLELSVYLNNYYPANQEPLTFMYSLGGEKREITLKPFETFFLSLGKQDFESLEITEAGESAGKLRVRARYTGSGEEILKGMETSEKLTLEKKLSPYNEKAGLYKVTVSYTVTLDSDRVSFALADRIPSGARLYRVLASTSSSDHCFAYLGNNGSGQMLTGSLSAYHPDQTPSTAGIRPVTYSGTVSYVIRAAYPGESAMTGAAAYSTESMTCALSPDLILSAAENGALTVRAKD